MNILIVTSSAQGEKSVSSRLAAHFAEQVRQAQPGSRIVVRDVGRDPLPHLVEDMIAGIRAEASSEAELATRAVSDALLEEVRAADIVLIASPMYNFGISSTLKTWFDYILRPRVAFRYSHGGPEGLLGPRKVIVIESRAGKYEAGDPADSQEPHLRQMLGFAGLDDLVFVRAEGLAFGEDAAAAAIADAEARLTALAGAALPLAA
jgi:FMN-dependent NADH-azoreductase